MPYIDGSICYTAPQKIPKCNRRLIYKDSLTCLSLLFLLKCNIEEWCRRNVLKGDNNKRI